MGGRKVPDLVPVKKLPLMVPADGRPLTLAERGVVGATTVLILLGIAFGPNAGSLLAVVLLMCWLEFWDKRRGL